MRDVSGNISKVIATVFFTGYVPVAPGTFGTLAGLLFILLLKPSITVQIVVLILVLIIGTIASGIAEKAFGQKDCRHIVIDEFAGYLCSIIFLPLTPVYMVAAFCLFRFFDILKPPPIRAIERIGGGAGIMLDDVAAGIITNILLQITVLLQAG
ncbi:MAG TPA: phosphatidylglycerophosphatase A [Dissulfurispiraceae bacterium]|nr:phosphatidylglycerophosphatase A [Dissulfurispiraceae bacterium]